MRLDETIVWRLSYANTPLHVIHTNNNINKNYIILYIYIRNVEQARRKTEREAHLCIERARQTTTKRKERKKEEKKKILLCRKQHCSHTHLH